ncbi:MAG: hypothetical protein Q4P17_10740 [Methanobacterium sp.]|nr:hypothetical protein [Methanobacterium sp.]
MDETTTVPEEESTILSDESSQQITVEYPDQFTVVLDNEQYEVFVHSQEQLSSLTAISCFLLALVLGIYLEQIFFKRLR